MLIALANDIILRNASPDDIGAYRDLRLEALKNHPETFGQDYDDAVSKQQSYWENTLKINPAEKALFFVVKDSQLIGMTGIYRNLSKKSQHGATIWGVYVRPAWRGKRISEALVSICLDWAKEQKIEIVKLAAVTNNAPAVHAYKRCGFTIYGTEPKAISFGGKYFDEYLMSIDLQNFPQQAHFALPGIALKS